MNPFFSKNNLENWKFLQNFWVFSKNYLKIVIFLEGPYKSREILDEFYYLVGKFIKKAQKLAEIEDYWKWDE